MVDLAEQACEACRADAPLVSDAELAELMRAIPDWVPLARGGVMQLERVFEFDDFKQALAFTNRIGDIAEQAGHHPVLRTEWGRVTVTWWSHEAGGLHKNDFILAARTDRQRDA